MIVKNEAAVIERCLTSVLPIIDYGSVDQLFGTLTTDVGQTSATGSTLNDLVAGRFDQLTTGVSQISTPVTNSVDGLTGYLNSGLLNDVGNLIAPSASSRQSSSTDPQLVDGLVSALDAQGLASGLMDSVPVGLNTIVQGLDVDNLDADTTALVNSLLNAGASGANELLAPVSDLVGSLTGGADPLTPVTNLVASLTGGTTDQLTPITDLVGSLTGGTTGPLTPITDLVGGLTGGTTDPLAPITDPVGSLTGGTTDQLAPITDLVGSLTGGTTGPLAPITDLLAGLTNGAAGPVAPVASLVDQALMLPVHAADLVSLAETATASSAPAPVTSAVEVLAPIQQAIVAQPAVQNLSDVLGGVLGHKLV